MPPYRVELRTATASGIDGEELGWVQSLSDAEHPPSLERVAAALSHPSELVRVLALPWVERRRSTAEREAERDGEMLGAWERARQEAREEGLVWTRLLDEVARHLEDRSRTHSLAPSLRAVLRQAEEQIEPWVRQERDAARLEGFARFRSRTALRSLARSARALSGEALEALEEAAGAELVCNAHLSPVVRGELVRRAWQGWQEGYQAAMSAALGLQLPSMRTLREVARREGLPRELRAEVREAILNPKHPAGAYLDVLATLWAEDRGALPEELEWVAAHALKMGWKSLLAHPRTPDSLFRPLPANSLGVLSPAASELLLGDEAGALSDSRLEVLLHLARGEARAVGRGLTRPEAGAELRARFLGIVQQSPRFSEVLEELARDSRAVNEEAVRSVLLAHPHPVSLSRALEGADAESFSLYFQALVQASPQAALQYLERRSGPEERPIPREAVGALLASASAEIRLGTIAALGRLGVELPASSPSPAAPEGRRRRR